MDPANNDGKLVYLSCPVTKTPELSRHFPYLYPLFDPPYHGMHISVDIAIYQWVEYKSFGK